MKQFHVKDEDKPYTDKEIKRLVHLEIMKESFFCAYSSPVILIRKKAPMLNMCYRFYVFQS